MNERDLDIVARTIVGEAANQPPEGQQAVANVILNRLRSGKFGATASDVVLAPYQFEPWQTRRAELEAIPATAPAYQSALRALQAAQASDPTNGATHFLEPNIVRQRRGGTLPAWAQGPSTQIGDHLFFSPGGGGPTRAASPTQSTTAVQPYSPPAAVAAPQGTAPSKATSIAEALALMDGDSVNMDEPVAPPAQSGLNPFALPQSEDVDPTIFQRRTASRGRPRAQRA